MPDVESDAPACYTDPRCGCTDETGIHAVTCRFWPLYVKPSVPNAESNADLWVVTELSLSLSAPPPEGEMHPETTPVGPFASRRDADAWANDYVGQFRSGSWSVAPLRTPGPRHTA